VKTPPLLLERGDNICERCPAPTGGDGNPFGMTAEEGFQDRESAQALLAMLLSSEDTRAIEQALATLLRDHAAPVIWRIVRARGIPDEEDAHSTAVLQLISRLRALKQSETKVENFEAYVAGITRNCCNQLLRAKYPEYSRLKNRIRYLLNHRSQFTLWEDEQGEHQCGLAAWKGKPARQQHPAAENPPHLGEFIPSLPPGTSAGSMRLEELIAAFLQWRGRPASLEDLVNSAAQLYGIRNSQPSGPRHDEGATNLGDLLPDQSVDIAAEFELRSELDGLWMEICQLPRAQRVALLLNLRDVQHRDALILLPLTGIASLRQIAATLEIPLEEWLSLWNRLPLDDLSIAQLLSLSRQQVINLRKSARERLARRMAAAGETRKKRNPGG
jgi:hypothetical protein